MNPNSIHHTAPFPAHVGHVARELYLAASTRGLVAALQALPLAYNTYGGDDEFGYELFWAIKTEAERVVKFLEPHNDAYMRRVEAESDALGGFLVA